MDKLDKPMRYCYECGVDGDDYRLDENGEWVSACEDCPFNPLTMEGKENGTTDV